jgi:hypothetical protein
MADVGTEKVYPVSEKVYMRAKILFCSKFDNSSPSQQQARSIMFSDYLNIAFFLFHRRHVFSK